MAVVLGAILFLGYHRCSTPVRAEYSGRITDRWAGYRHSEYNPGTYFRLRIQSETGEQFTVRVSSEVYERARVGMWIERRNSQTRLAVQKADLDSPDNAPLY